MSDRANFVGRVMAVVVAYHPEETALRSLLDSLAGQVDALVVVDNTPDGSSIASHEVDRIRVCSASLIQWGENRGIADALNAGIEVARRETCDFVLLSDQDSLPSEGMVREMLQVFGEAAGQGMRVACVSPEYFDRTTDQAFPFQVQLQGKLFYSTVGGDSARPWLEALTTITSGSLIPMAVLEDVGGMKGEYFIDNVDIEWCLRARSKGYVILGTSKVRLHHQLGRDAFPVWVLRWRKYGAYSPVRFYYKYRNFLLMWRLPYVPLRWKIRACWYWLGQFYVYVVFSPDRWKNLSMIGKGLWDGIRGRVGPIDRPRA